MECREYEGQVQDFLRGQLSDEDAMQFINHVQNCARCYDELEIYFSIFRGIGMSNEEELIEDDAFELDGTKEDLTILLEQMLREIKKRKMKIQLKAFMLIFCSVTGFVLLLTMCLHIF